MSHPSRCTAALIGLALPGFALAHGVDPADIVALEKGGNLAYLWLGAKHMVTGYDHLLFLFGVVFFLTRFGDIVKFVTAFTAGHSITLMFGTLMGIKVSPYLVDAVIALTVIYKGLENIDGFRRHFGFGTPNLASAVFVFGLIHGFGLATRLQEMPLPKEGLIARILSFNIGVELGQIAALVVMLAVLAAWRRREALFAILSNVTNKGLIAAGTLLFLFQMHGYLHNSYPDELGFSEDLHSHAHQDMGRARARARHTENLD